LQPGDVGLEAGARRRTPGLRRTEVARLAGLSIEYYIRLEQARPPSPSRQVLEALCRALRLSRDERTYMFHLAGQTPAATTRPSHEVGAGIVHLLASLQDTPALVIDPKHDVLAWNPMAAALFTDFSALRPTQRNLFRQIFTNPAALASISPQERTAFVHQAVGDLRAAHARYPNDPSIHALITDLHTASDEFAALWQRHVQMRRHTTKQMHHAIVGTLELDCQTLEIPDHDQRLLLYTAAPGTPSHASLQLLRVLGTQDMSAPTSTPPQPPP
jgi:transcriptional regulator with XRE-family HTH domain